MKWITEHKAVVFLIAITVAVAILIGIFAAFASGEKATVAEGITESVSVPGQKAASGIGGKLNEFFGYFGSIKALKEENERLKKENIELDKRLRDSRGMEAENYELREMLDLVKTENQLDLVAAKVVAKDPSNWYSSFTINKGTNSGIAKGQPVLTANEELVGRVYKVGSDWAEVITILDPESGVGSIIERSKCTGVTEGDFSLKFKGQCRLGYLSRDADIEVDDYVETSGMGGAYPKGLLIGKVMEIKEDNANMSKYAIIEPVADIDRLMQVFVLTNSVEVIERAPDYKLDEEEDADKDNDDSNSSSDDEEDRSSSSSSNSKRENTSSSERESNNSRNNNSNSGNSQSSNGSSTAVRTSPPANNASGTTGSSGSAQTRQSGGTAASAPDGLELRE